MWSGFVETGQPIDTSTFQLLIKWDLSLYGLSFLKHKIDTTDKLQFPLNSLVLKLADGFYWVANSPEPKGTVQWLRLTFARISQLPVPPHTRLVLGTTWRPCLLGAEW